MRILITGGCGYVGTVLTQTLLNDGHEIIVVDTQWFGNYLPNHPKLTILKQDVRDMDSINLEGVKCILHMANIANDPCVELNPTLSWEVNVLAAQQLAEMAIRAGVKEEEHVTEDLTLVPISVYNKTKMVAERVFLSYKDHMQVINIRPATVCGYSPRMRLDVSVNLLTMLALKNGKITVFGGQQTRPNIHMQDLIRVYVHFLKKPKLPSGCYNAGFENISILDIAKQVQEKVPSEIVISESNDPRSYRQNSDKLKATGFEQKYFIKDAIDEVIEKYRSGELKDAEQCYNVKWMKHLKL